VKPNVSHLSTQVLVTEDLLRDDLPRELIEEFFGIKNFVFKVAGTNISQNTGGTAESCQVETLKLLNEFIARQTMSFPKEEIVRILKVSKNKSQQWIQSRSLVLEVWNELVEGLKGNARSEYCIKSSLSHSQGESVVFSIADKQLKQSDSKNLSGVGVDFEFQDRSIPEAAFRFVGTQEERDKFLNPLEYWTSKEALFKSHPESSGRGLKDFKILSVEKIQHSVFQECKTVNALSFDQKPQKAMLFAFKQRQYAIAVTLN
jgi:predicted RNase H-like nuclease